MANRADSFNRADSTSTLGTPSDGGGAWTALNGTWGISSNTGYLVSSTSQAVAVLDAAASIVRIGFTVSSYTADIGLIGRATDNSNYFVAVISSNTTVYRQQAGSFTSLGGTVTPPWATGDLIEYEIDSSNAHRIYRNGSVVFGPYTDTFQSTATKHGLRSNAITAARFEDFYITDLAPSSSILPMVRHHRGKIMRGY